MTFSFKKIIQLFISAAVTFLLLFYIFEEHDLTNLLKELKKANLFFVGLGILLTFIGYYLRALRWRLMLAPTSSDLSRSHVFWGMMSGYFLNMIIPRMGEVSRCLYLNKTNGVPVDKSLGTVITERISDVILLTLVIVIAVFLEPGLILQPLTKIYHTYMGYIDLSSTKFYIVLSILLLGLFGIYYLLRLPAVKRIGGEKVASFLVGIKTGILSIKEMPDRKWFILQTLLIWSSYFMLYYACFFCFEATKVLGLREAFILMAISGIGMVIPLPVALGAFILVIKGLEFYGFNALISTSFTNVIFSVQLLFVFASGGLSLLLVSFLTKKKKA